MTAMVTFELTASLDTPDGPQHHTRIIEAPTAMAARRWATETWLQQWPNDCSVERFTLALWSPTVIDSEGQCSVTGSTMELLVSGYHDDCQVWDDARRGEVVA